MLSVAIKASDTVAEVGSTIQLTCSLRVQPEAPSAVAYTTHDIKWYRHRIDEDRAEVRSVQVNGTNSEVILANVSLSDSGKYTCCLTDACDSPADVQIRIGCKSFKFKLKFKLGISCPS